MFSPNQKKISIEALAQSIDHTLLKAEATSKDIEVLCKEAENHGFYSVCINPRFVPLARKLLSHTPVKTITVVGFPLGANSLKTKIAETEFAIQDGAQEIDLVLSLNDVKLKLWENLHQEVNAVVKAAQVPVKVILETAALSHEEILRACEVCAQAGASFVKTSTGFHPNGGATLEAVELMVKTVAPKVKVKASGGIRTFAQAISYLNAGASRLGVSASVAIIKEARGEASPVSQESPAKKSGY